MALEILGLNLLRTLVVEVEVLCWVRVLEIFVLVTALETTQGFRIEAAFGLEVVRLVERVAVRRLMVEGQLGRLVVVLAVRHVAKLGARLVAGFDVAFVVGFVGKLVVVFVEALGKRLVVPHTFAVAGLAVVGVYALVVGIVAVELVGTEIALE